MIKSTNQVSVPTADQNPESDNPNDPDIKEDNVESSRKEKAGFCLKLITSFGGTIFTWFIFCFSCSIFLHY